MLDEASSEFGANSLGLEQCTVIFTGTPGVTELGLRLGLCRNEGATVGWGFGTCHSTVLPDFYTWYVHTTRSIITDGTVDHDKMLY